MLHRAELRQEALALRLAAERIDHPGRHVVDRDVGRGRGAALGQLLKDDRGVEPGEVRAADIVLHVNPAEAEGRSLAQGFHREGRVLVPLAGMRHHLGARKRPRGVLNCALLFGEVKVHGGPRAFAYQAGAAGRNRSSLGGKRWQTNRNLVRTSPRACRSLRSPMAARCSVTWATTPSCSSATAQKSSRSAQNARTITGRSPKASSRTARCAVPGT